MRIKLKALRKIIQESISQAHLQKLQTLFESGDEANYNMAIELWDTLDPGGCPYPPFEEFWGHNGQPLIMDIFSETIMSMEDHVFFHDYCSAEWLSPKHELKFDFTFPFVVVDEDSYWDGEGQRYYIVPETDSYSIEAWIKKEIGSEIWELSHHDAESFWVKWKSIDVYIDDEHLEELGNGHATVTISYT